MNFVLVSCLFLNYTHHLCKHEPNCKLCDLILGAKRIRTSASQRHERFVYEPPYSFPLAILGLCIMIYIFTGNSFTVIDRIIYIACKLKIEK